MRLRTLISLTIATILTAGFLSGDTMEDLDSADTKAQPSPPIKVDCAHGDRLTRALRRAKRMRGPVEIEIRGICEESVIIDRPQLTLRGSNPATDGIRGDGKLPNTVIIDTVWDIRIENLSLLAQDPFTATALGIGQSFRISIVNCQLEGTVFGAIGNGSTFRIEDTTLSGGFAALQAAAGSNGSCIGCTLNDGGLSGSALRIDNARFFLADSSAEARFGAVIRTGGWATIRRSTLRAVADTAGRVQAVSVSHASRLSLEESRVEGTIFATEKSIIKLDGVAQAFTQPGAESHSLELDSLLHTAGATTLEGDLRLSNLAEAVLGGGTALGGSVVCDPTAEAWCSDGVTVGGSTCSRCPAP